jgi:hypothetical protein
MACSSASGLGTVGAAATTDVASMAVAVITDAVDITAEADTAGAAPTVGITDAALTTDAVLLTVDTADAETSERRAAGHLAAAGAAETSERRAAGHLAAAGAAATSNRTVVAASTVVAAPAVVAADSTAAEAAGLMVADMAEAIAKTRKS